MGCLAFGRSLGLPESFRDTELKEEVSKQWLKEQLATEMQRLEAHIGRTPDLDLIPFLYCPDDSITQLPQDEDQYNVFRVLVDGVVVRFTEESHLVRAVVEGRLSQERLRALQESVRNKLSAAEGATWEIETL